MRNISIIISTITILVFLLSSEDSMYRLSISADSALPTRITYLFMHASILHLSINIYALLTLSFICRASLWQMCTSCIVAITIPTEILPSAPMVGLSTVIYALSGLVIMRQSKWWKLMVLNLSILAIQSAVPSVAFAAHLYCFFVGAFIGFFTIPRYEAD